jgi:thiamine monophosphate synthase
MKFDPTLYLVTDSTGRTDDDFLSILEKALTGGVTLVQLREKERGSQKLFATATVCRLSSTTARTSPWRQMRRAYT